MILKRYLVLLCATLPLTAQKNPAEGFSGDNRAIVKGEAAAVSDHKPDRAKFPREVLRFLAREGARVNVVYEMLKLTRPLGYQETTDAERKIEIRYKGDFPAMIIKQEIKSPREQEASAQLFLQLDSPGISTPGRSLPSASGKDITVEGTGLGVAASGPNMREASLLGAFCHSLLEVQLSRHVQLEVSRIPVSNDPRQYFENVSLRTENKTPAVLAGVQLDFFIGNDGFMAEGFALGCGDGESWAAIIDNGVTVNKPEFTEKEKELLAKLRNAKGLQYSPEWKIESVNPQCTKKYCKTVMKSFWREP